jgi:hypothetical protein
MEGGADSRKLRERVSRTTPTTSKKLKRGFATEIRCPSGRPSRNCRAKVSFTMAAPDAPGRSPALNSRPSTTGVPMTSKYRGATRLRYTGSLLGGGWLLMETGSVQVKPLRGALLDRLADKTPGRCSNRWSNSSYRAVSRVSLYPARRGSTFINSGVEPLKILERPHEQPRAHQQHERKCYLRGNQCWKKPRS